MNDLNLITGIDRPTLGTVTVDGQRIDTMKEERLAALQGVIDAEANLHRVEAHLRYLLGLGGTFRSGEK